MLAEKNDVWIKRLLIGALGFGIIASLVNFFNFRSLWLDEALLSISIVDRNYVELLLPLEKDQVAPIGFLFLENFFSSLFGNTDWSLRIFPLVSFLASIFLIYKLNVRLFKSKVVALLSASLFSLNTFALYYSIEVKQYMSDVFLCLLVLVSALSYFDSKTKKSLIVYTCVSALSVWFSNIVVVILFTVGLIGLYQVAIKEKLKSIQGLVPIVAGIVSFAIYYMFFVHQHPAKEAMLVYWTENFGFLYKDVLSWEFRYFIRTRLQSIIQVLLEFGNYWMITSCFIAIGAVFSFKNKKALFLLLVPLCVHLGLSYFKLYPFDRRLVLYALPLLISLMSFGIYSSWKILNKVLKIPVYIILVPLLFNLVAVIGLLPFEKEEIKKSMTYLNANVTADDEIYVYSVSRITFDFYKDGFENINASDAIFYSERNRRNWSSHNQDLVKLKGSVWLVFSHTDTNVKNGSTEKDYILSTMKSNGYEIVDKKEYVGSSVYKMEK